jgi:hypothetical protein
MIGPAVEVCASNLFLVLGKMDQDGCDLPEAVHWRDVCCRRLTPCSILGA